VMKTMLLTKLKIAATVVFLIAATVGSGRLLVPTGAAEGADEPKQVQLQKSQQTPQKDKPRIVITERFAGGFEVQVLFVRDPSSGKYKPLRREDGIPAVKGYIEFHTKKLKEAKDDNSIREALKGIEECVQNMQELLSFPGAPAEPEKKEPGREQSARVDEGGSSKNPSDDTWEVGARRLLAGLSPQAPPWGNGDTWEMNGFWYSSPWGKGDTWKLKDLWRSSPWGKGDTWRINKVMEKGGFWSPRASAM
jgi:hypothetical protein